MTTPQNNPIARLLFELQVARAQLAAIEQAEHPDVTDRFGRVWTWCGKDLYAHCGIAAPKDRIDDFVLPSQTALDNPNYDPCDICLDGRDRHVTACKREWECSHATCARIHAAEDAEAQRSADYYDPAILLPNRLILGVVNASCPCGASFPVRDGILGTHFPVMYEGRPPVLKDPFAPGTAACRNSGRAVTVEAAQRRDEALADAERRIAARVRDNPAAWLGLLEWVALADVATGERVGFTETVQPDPYGPRMAVERAGVVKRRGKTFIVIACDEDGLAGEVRLTAKTWGRARVRRK